MHAADTLSIAYLPKTDTEEDLELEIHANMIYGNPPLISDEKLAEMQSETKKDLAMTKPITTILNGWPQQRESVSVDIRQYWSYRDKLSLHNGIVFGGENIVIHPSSMRNTVLEKIDH